MHHRHHRDARRRQARHVGEDATALDEDLGLVVEVRSRALDQVDQRQAVAARDLLGAQPLAQAHRRDGAALDRAVVGEHQDARAGDVADDDDGGAAGDARVPIVVVEAEPGQRRELEERRSGVEQPSDALARHQLSAPREALAGVLGLPANRVLEGPHLAEQAQVLLAVAAEGFRARIDPRLENRHGGYSTVALVGRRRKLIASAPGRRAPHDAPTTVRETQSEIPGFRTVPRTGVIYVMHRAEELGFGTHREQWSNLGQGAPEVRRHPRRAAAPRAGPAPAQPSRVRADRRHPRRCASASPNFYNAIYRRGKRSQYTAENVSIAPGGRAAMTRLAAALGEINMGHFIPDYTAYEELLGSFKGFVPIPILQGARSSYRISIDELRREMVGRGLQAILCSNPATRPDNWSRATSSRSGWSSRASAARR